MLIVNLLEVCDLSVFSAKRIAAAYSIMAYPKQFPCCKANTGILLCEVLLQVSPVRIWAWPFVGFSLIHFLITLVVL